MMCTNILIIVIQFQEMIFFFLLKVWQGNSVISSELDNQDSSINNPTNNKKGNSVDNEMTDNQQTVNSHVAMETGPVIKMGLGALASRKGKGDINFGHNVYCCLIGIVIISEYVFIV